MPTPPVNHPQEQKMSSTANHRADEEARIIDLSRKAVLALTFRMLLAFIRSSVGHRAKMIFSFLLLLLIAINGFNVMISYVSRDFMTAIEQQQMAEFLRQAMFMIGLFVISTVASAFTRFCEEHLGLLWRASLTEKIVNQYLDERTFQHIEASHEVMHPDQRISEDIRILTTSALSFMLMVVNSALSIIAFAGVLWAISPMLFLVSLVYATCGSVFTILLGRTLIALNSKQADREADFRSELLHIRAHAEPIVILRLERNFRHRLIKRLNELVANTRRMISVNRNLAFFTGNYNYLIQIIPALVVAPLFIDGKAEFGVIAQSALAFTILVNAFSLIVSQFPSLSNFAAVTARLSALAEATEKAHDHFDDTLMVIEDNTRLYFDNVNFYARDQETPTLRDFTVNIPQGTRVLICGSSKQAMQVFFNTVAGIEHKSTGTLHRPHLNQIYFLPEKPYLAPGTLREALMHPDWITPVDDTAIVLVLHKLGLENVLDLAGGLDTPHNDWNHFLSISEQKMVGIARMLLAAPRFAVMQRLRSSLSESKFELVLSLLQESGITYINLGKFEHLECYDAVIELLDNGTWAWENARAVHLRKGQKGQGQSDE